MTISDRERALLSAVQFHADESAAKLAKKAKIPEHTFYYGLKRLVERGVIRRGALVDLRKLGLNQFAIYFSLSSSSIRAKKSLMTHLARHERIAWLAELGGDYLHGLSVCAADASGASEFLEELAIRFGAIISKKSVVSLVSFTQFQKKYLNERGGAPESATFGKGSERVEIDESDWRILAGLAGGGMTGSADLARAAGIPRTTVEYRIKRLEEKKIILKHMYFISAAKLGMQTYKLLVSARGVRPELSVKLYEFAKADRHVVLFIHCLGSWDYELVVEVNTHAGVIELVERLQSEFKDELDDVRILTVFTQTTSTRFLQPAGK